MTLAQLLAAFTVPPWIEHGRSLGGRPLTHRRWHGRGMVPPVLFHGAIHGNEPLGSYCLERLAERLDATPVEALPRDVWIAPIVNPDGFLLGRKDNDAGVDLNRNWPAKNWSPEVQGGCNPGARASSEPETQALLALIDRIAPVLIVTLHSPFRTVNYDGPAKALAERMGALNGYGASADIGYPTPGSFGSLYGVDRGLPVITLEIPKMTPLEAWEQNQDALWAAIDGK